MNKITLSSIKINICTPNSPDYKRMKGAINNRELVWVNIKIPTTWIEYRLEHNPDLLLLDQYSETTWFPIYTEKQVTEENSISVPAGIDEVMIYVSDQDVLSGVVLNPFTDCILIPKEFVCALANLAEKKCTAANWDDN